MQSAFTTAPASWSKRHRPRLINAPVPALVGTMAYLSVSSASPIIALGGVNVLPRNFARGNLNALQEAVAVGRVVILVIRNIDRTNIRRTRRPKPRCRSSASGVRQARRQPLADQLVRSNRLDRTAVERNDDKAVGIDRTRGVALTLEASGAEATFFARGRITS